MLEPHVRRRTTGGCSTISSSDGTCINAESEQQQQQQQQLQQHVESVSLWAGLYHVLGGWLIDAAVPGAAAPTLPAEAALASSRRSSGSITSSAPGRQASFGQISSWAIRAAMLDICLPANLLWSSPLASRSSSPSDEPGSSGVTAQVHPLRAPGDNPLDSPRKGASALHAAKAAAAAGCSGAGAGPDVMKGCRGCDCNILHGWQCDSKASKQQSTPGSLVKAASCGSLSAASDQELVAAAWLSQQGQQRPGCDALQHVQDAAGAAAGQCGMRGSLTLLPSSSQLEAQAELRRLRREISSLRSCLGSLTLTVSALKQENQRLQLVDGSGEELLGQALQQLLGEKSQLQQQLSQLARRNQALQELLDFTTAPPVTSAAELAAGDAGAEAAAREAAAAMALDWRSSSQAAAGPPLVRASRGSGGSDDDGEDGADDGVYCYFATPVASRAQSPVGASKCGAGVGAEWRPLGVDAAAV